MQFAQMANFTSPAKRALIDLEPIDSRLFVLWYKICLRPNRYLIWPFKNSLTDVLGVRHKLVLHGVHPTTPAVLSTRSSVDTDRSIRPQSSHCAQMPSSGFTGDNVYCTRCTTLSLHVRLCCSGVTQFLRLKTTESSLNLRVLSSSVFVQWAAHCLNFAMVNAALFDQHHLCRI